MLLAPHILVGAAVAVSTSNPILGLLFAFLSHFILDRIPHWEYSAEALKTIPTKGILYVAPILRRVALDITAGFVVLIVAVAISSDNIPFTAWAFGGFFGILPDGLSFLLFTRRKNGRWGKFLKENRASLQPLMKEFLEMRLDLVRLPGVPKDLQ